MSITHGRGRPRSLAGLAAVLLAATGLTTLVGSAHADPVTGTYVGRDEATESEIVRARGDGGRSTTSLLDLQVGSGQVLQTYCIKHGGRLQEGSNYAERGWDETVNNADKINWILHNSYPSRTVEELKDELGGGPSVSRLDKKKAVAATQAAIWHFSDGFEMETRLAKYDEPRSEVHPVIRLYQHLVREANGDMGDAPGPSLDLAPDSKKGQAGGPIGPFTVGTSADQIDVALEDAPEAIRLTDKDGAEVDTASDGDELYVDVPDDAAAGSATVVADGTGKVETGQVFTGRTPNGDEAQKLILVSSDEVPLHDEVEAMWDKAPKPAPDAEAKEVCEPGAGVAITLTNEGDAPAEFTVGGNVGGNKVDDKVDDKVDHEVTVAPGEEETVLVEVEEDAEYALEVTSGGFSKTFEGVLDCLPDETTPPKDDETPRPTETEQAGGPGLPDTGASNVGWLVALGIALLVIGAGLVFFFQRRGRHAK